MTTPNPEVTDAEYGLTATQRDWPQALKDAYRAYRIDDDEFDFVGGLYAARKDRPEELAQLQADRENECCGWHEETIDVDVEGEQVQLLVAFSYGH